MNLQLAKMNRTAGGYARLPEDAEARLRKVLREHGDDGAARRFGVHRQTLTRAACGLEVQAASALVILALLEQIEGA